VSGALRAWGGPVLAAAALHVVLVQPNHPDALTPGALRVFPLELPAILLALLALPARAALPLRAALVAALTVIGTLKLADFASFTALSRGFNPVADGALVAAAFRLAAGTFGTAAAVALVALAALAIAAVAAALWWATGVWARLTLPRAPAVAAGGAALLAAGVATAEIGAAMGTWRLPASPPGAAFTARLGVERLAMARATWADLRAFDAAARADPYAGAAPVLDRIDRDVLVIFVESYGRGALDTPLYADTIRATLAAAEGRLAARGLAMRSGWLDAPTRGGQSWLSHATFATGLRVGDQTRYAAALASDRAGLFHIAARAGFRTAAVMPAITLAWPESAQMGFGTVLAAADLGYAGPPFNWVTMPDQFTLAALDRRLRDGAAAPLFAQVALVSSHAPWVPVPDLVPWEAVGDGAVFAPMAARGDPPDVVWRDRDRVRAQYRKAVDYALRATLAYAERHAGEPPLILVIGDHQPAAFVAGDARPDVPAHLIGPPGLVEAAALWGWGAGLIPAPDAPLRGMEEMRDLILSAWSTGGPVRGARR